MPEPTPTEGSIRLAHGVTVPASAVRMSYASSSGPGGQNVNRRATKAELRLALVDVPITDAARRRLRLRAAHLVTDAGELIIISDKYRSQARNRQACMDRLRELVAMAIVEPKKRRKTKPSRGSIERRLESKRQQSQKKGRRQRPEGE
jgi:ribosome-associated protein